MPPIASNEFSAEAEELLPASLESSPSARRCPICGGGLALHLRAVECHGKGSFDILRCGHCGLGKTHPMPADLGLYYENYHGGRHGASAQLSDKRRTAIVADSTRAQGPGALLDVGCGDGSFLLAAQKSGWRVLGTELNPLRARQRGLQVVTDIREIPETSRFDCITLWHSLEHLRDPLSTIASLRNYLSPTGVLLIAVPDFAGIQAKLFGRRWFHLDVPRHLYHFSKSSLSALLQTTGFRLLQWRHQEFEYDLIGWPQSALNCVLPTPNVFVDLLMGRTSSCSLAERVTGIIGGALLTALALPLVAMGSLINRGGTLVVAAGRSDFKPDDSQGF